jgi:sugar/nucleoside kinase (ribokinase family)
MTSYFLQTRLQSSFPQIFRDARKLGLTTSFDPNSDPTHAWKDSIRKVFAYTDLLFLNQTEALQVTRARSVKEALKALSKEVPCVVIKLGPKGAMAIKNGEISSAAGFSIAPIDTTGAGDSFAAGFVVSYLRGDSIADCLRAGNACGALSTLQAGGTEGQPDYQTLKNFLDAN